MFPTTQNPEMIQAVQAVVDAGNELFRMPERIDQLGPNGVRLRALLQTLTSELARYPAAQSSAAWPALPPVWQAANPKSLLGVAVPVPLIILVIILIVLTEEAIRVSATGRPAPKVTMPKLTQPLDPLLMMAKLVELLLATDLHAKVKDMIKKVDDCKTKHPDHECSKELLDRFDAVSKKLLVRLVARRTMPQDRVSVNAADNAIVKLQKELDDILDLLRKCLGCGLAW